MPRLSQYFIRSAFLYLAFGFTIGGLILASKAGVISPLVWLWLPAHILLLLNGWVTQLAMGVGYWILPRILGSERGRPAFAWASFSVFQLGLLLAAASLLQIAWTPAGDFLGPGVVLQTLGIGLFVIHAWPRIRPTFIRAAVADEKQ